MAFSLNDAFHETSHTYKLKVQAGKNGMNHTISWVHLLEDTTIIHQFWGKELAVTTGLGFQTEDKLYDLVSLLIQHNCAGLIINIGQYITQIPSSILLLCNENDFPLLTVPWEIYVADLIKDYCIRTFTTQKEEQKLSRLCIKSLQAPDKIPIYAKELSSYFHMDGEFILIAASVQDSITLDMMDRQKISFELRSYFENLPYNSCFFAYESDFLFILNDIEYEDLKKLISDLESRTHTHDKQYLLSYGLSDRFHGFYQLPAGYEHAKAALTMAKVKKKHSLSFDDMGFYQLFYCFQDKDLLINLYENTLAPLRSFDELHNGDYEDTLYYYLKYNGSIQAVSDALFTHRNTINYRMGKIKEILNCPLSTTEERFPFLLAFYIKETMLP